MPPLAMVTGALTFGALLAGMISGWPSLTILMVKMAGVGGHSCGVTAKGVREASR